MIERTSAESREPDYTLPDLEEDDIIKKVAYSRAIDLVLTAAREYFDSSANLTDSSMDLARACLSLIEDKPSVIQEELDLIDALALLDGFGVSILPLQVRMCKKRLDLIQNAISAKAFTYKNSQRLLKLGQLLRVAGENKVDRDGKVLRLTVQAALKAKDVGVAYHTCYRLMEMGYPEIWKECKQLAEMEDFNNIQAKTELLSFSVTHCSPEMIEPILRAKCLLETQTLYERVHSKMSDRDSQSPIDNPFTAKGAIQQTKDLLSNTNKATRQVLSSVSNKAWWKKTLKSLHSVGPRGKTSDEDDDLNTTFTKQGCHPFYESLVPGSYTNKSEVDYEAYQAVRPDLAGLHFSESLLYAGKLEETLSEGESYHTSGEVLLQLAEDTLAVDSSLGLAYLLALPEPADAEQCFQNKPGSAISLQLAAYYYALQMYSRLDPATAAKIKPLYHYAPTELVQKMQSHVHWKETNPESSRTGTWDEEFGRLVEKLKHYNELLMDYNQAQILQGLDRGIDIGRFTVDAEYKKETILGLAMTTEDKVYQIAVTLATRYNLPLWDVYMGHLEYLFESGIPTEELETRTSQLGIIPTLKGDGQTFYERMQKYVHPTITGSDHDRLIVYYGMLEGCADKAELVSPANHVKLLKKIKHAAPGLDYRKLTDRQSDPLDILRPVLTADNINALAKVASKLPNQHGGYLHPSVVYCGWAIQTFWQGGKKKVSEKTDWIHRYEACGEYLQKLHPEDVLRFVYAITFVKDAVQELQTDIRRQIIRRALKYGRQQAANKKRVSENEGQISWEEVTVSLQHALEHLDRLNHPTIAGMKESEDPQSVGYAQEYDLSRSDEQKLHRLYLHMVIDGSTPEDVNDVMSVNSKGTWTTRTAYTESVQTITGGIRGENTNDPLLKDEDPLTLLRTVVSQVGDHQENGGDLVSSEDLMTLLRPFCADSAVPVDKRLEVLTILEECFNLHDEDLVLLTLYRTEAIVTTSWPTQQITEAHISSHVTRMKLFGDLLTDSQQISQFRSLTSLLEVWPADSSQSAPAQPPWCELLCKMVTTCGQQSAEDVLKIIRKLKNDEQPLSEQSLMSLCDVLLRQNLPLVAVKCLLIPDEESFNTKAIELLAEEKEAPEVEDEELCSLILQRHLSANIIKTVFYPTLVDFILANQSTDGSTPYHLSVETVANQLQDVGYEAEAGSLMARHRGMHPGLRTFDAALGLLNRWFSS